MNPQKTLKSHTNNERDVSLKKPKYRKWKSSYFQGTHENDTIINVRCKNWQAIVFICSQINVSESSLLEQMFSDQTDDQIKLKEFKSSIGSDICELQCPDILLFCYWVC